MCGFFHFWGITGVFESRSFSQIANKKSGQSFACPNIFILSHVSAGINIFRFFSSLSLICTIYFQLFRTPLPIAFPGYQWYSIGTKRWYQWSSSQRFPMKKGIEGRTFKQSFGHINSSETKIKELSADADLKRFRQKVGFSIRKRG